MQVFISSLIGGFESFREAANRSIASLGHEAIRVETFPAKPSTPQAACLAGVREADLFILIIGEHYGERQNSGFSATHEEYLEARERIPVLLFVQEGVEREAAQESFLNDIRGWSTGGLLYKSFRTGEQLQDAVTRAVHDHQLANARGPLDEAALIKEATGALETRRHRSTLANEAALAVSISAGPIQQILRPAEIEGKALIRLIQKEATFGHNTILDSTQGTDVEIEDNRLRISQRRCSLSLHQNGSILVFQPASSAVQQGFMSVLLEEDIQASISRALRFAGWLLDEVDPVQRVTDVVVATALGGAGHAPWMTRAELATNIGSYTLGTGDDPPIILLTPPRTPRQALLQKADSIAEDIVVLLRRNLMR